MQDKNSKSPIFQSSVPEKAVLWRKVESLPVQGVLFENSSTKRTGSGNEPRRDHLVVAIPKDPIKSTARDLNS